MITSRLILSISLILAGWFPAAGQEAKLCDHLTVSKERFEAIRLLPPVTVIYFDGRRIEYSYEDSRGIYLGSFLVDAKTELAAEFGKRYKSEPWWMLFCAKDRHLYSVHPLGPIQKKAIKSPQ